MIVFVVSAGHIVFLPLLFLPLGMFSLGHRRRRRREVNVNGGALALDHPIGASAAQILLTLIHALHRDGGGLGHAATCSGGGQGDALLVEV